MHMHRCISAVILLQWSWASLPGGTLYLSGGLSYSLLLGPSDQAQSASVPTPVSWGLRSSCLFWERVSCVCVLSQESSHWLKGKAFRPSFSGCGLPSFCVGRNGTDTGGWRVSLSWSPSPLSCDKHLSTGETGSPNWGLPFSGTEKPETQVGILSCIGPW